MSVLKDSQHLRLSLKEIKLATNNFNEPIGKGGYGMVYKGELCIFGRPTTVAVKTLGEKSWQGLKQFLTEIQLLTGQNHKNIISLLGYCDEYKHKSLVYEYAARGSLDTYLWVGSKISLTWKKRLEICLDAARGLNHLHSNVRKKRTIIHRDIKSANILLDDNWVAKIADLGLSKLYFEDSEENSIVSDVCGTPGYCDPKYYDGILKKEYDIYSFGIVLFELLCGRLCNVQHKKGGFVLTGASVQKYYKENKMKEIIDPCLREQMSLYSINKFSEIAYNCLLNDEGQRPSLDRVVKELEELLLIQAMEVESLKSNSCSSDPISKLRYQKVKRIFQQFDFNRDGCLEELELACLLEICNPDQDEEQLDDNVKHFFSLYGDFIEGEEGLNCDGLFKFYDFGIDRLDKDFEKLNLKLKPLEEYELALRYEKLRRIFQRFDINEDGCLNKEELTELFIATSEVKKDEETCSSLVDYLFSVLWLFTNGEKGLTCDGLLRSYEFAVDELDDDFKKLRLDLKPLDDREDALRKRERAVKVRIMFERFDLNGDGGLDKWELGILLLKRNRHNEAPEEVSFEIHATFRCNHFCHRIYSSSDR